MTTESEPTPLVAAVDLGGTYTKIGLIDRNATVLAETKVPTKITAGPDGDGGLGTVSWLGDEIAAFVEAEAPRPAQQVVGFGVIVPGIINSESGTVIAAPNIGWYEVEVAGPLTERLGLPGAIGHDVRTAGLAEWQLGAARGSSNLLFVPLGTGIAAAVVVDGRLLEADGYAGELGHTPVPAAGELVCACGGIGCLEIVASAAGVVRNYTRVTNFDRVPSAEEIAASARNGDHAAQSAFELAATALAEAFVIAVTLFGPETIVIGGGLSGAADLLLPRIEQEFDRRLTFQRRPSLIISAFGSQAGMVGAGLLGWNSVPS
ncbi:ROK family protein [Microlunatus elymi]|uniref:ROK family protein n=1 Tax=Microlunatus elymi TaxID=2596828 RepID=A0A516Q3P0_9ACTN|nr:ROK family protein [Microlunatus elymi]QDP98046.1 ROK family protein [Microlunatus elymi]